MSIRKNREEIARLVPTGMREKLEEPIVEYPTRYRKGPREQGVILRGNEDGSIRTDLAEFGLLFGNPPKSGRRPLWSNARAEGLTSTYPWKLLKKQRCLAIADGFYEPEKKAQEKGTVPWSFYQRREARPFYLAGLWNEFTDPDTGEIVLTFAVVTLAANEVITIHNRMPAMIALENEEAAMRWLLDDAWPLDLLRPYPADDMEGWRVTDKARSSRSADGMHLIDPVRETEEPQTTLL